MASGGISNSLHCTFFGNEAEQLGAITLLFSGQSIRIDNSILWNNSDANGNEIDVNSELFRFIIQSLILLKRHGLHPVEII